MRSISCRTMPLILLSDRLPKKRDEQIPAPSCRIYPARTRNLWLATSASAGASRNVGINSCDHRCIDVSPELRVASAECRLLADLLGESIIVAASFFDWP